MCTPIIDPGCDPLKEFVRNSARQALQEIADEMRKAAAKTMEWTVANWLHAPSASLFEGQAGAVTGLRNATFWLATFVAVMSLIIAGGRMALQRDGKSAGDVLKGLAVLVLASSAGLPAIYLLMSWGDDYSVWILQKGSGGNFGGRMAMLGMATVPAFLSGAGAVIIIFFSLLVMVVSFLQLVLLLLRTGALVLMAGLLPLAAAAGLTGTGQQMRNRYFSWLLGLILYKPAAASAIAAGFFMVGTAQDLVAFLTGLMMMVVAIVALPALMRLIAPAVATVSSGGGTAALAGVAAGGALATGAIELGGHMHSRAGSSASGGAGPIQAPAGASQVSPGMTPATGAGSSAGASTAGAAGATSGAAGVAGVAVGAANAAQGAVQAARSTAHGAVGEGEQR